MEKRYLKVVGALIEEDGKFLLAQRLADDRYGLLWEFPGGKIEEDETQEEALKREMEEELGIAVEVKEFIASYEDEVPDLKIKVDLYQCKIINGKPAPLQCQSFGWFSPDQIKALELAPADKKAYQFLEHKFKNKVISKIIKQNFCKNKKNT